MFHFLEQKTKSSFWDATGRLSVGPPEYQNLGETNLYVVGLSPPPLNPHWHELWKQEKCSSLVPPKDIFYKTQWACQGVKLTLLKSIFTSKKVWNFFVKIKLTKSDAKRTGSGVPSLMPIRVNQANLHKENQLLYESLEIHFVVN